MRHSEFLRVLVEGFAGDYAELDRLAKLGEEFPDDDLRCGCPGCRGRRG